MELSNVGNLLYKGSSKDLYEMDDKTIAFRFLDTFSIDDVGRSVQEIPGKGIAVHNCALKSFWIAETVGIPTNYIENLDHVTIRVKKANIIKKPTRRDENYVVPLEFISRYHVAGSIHISFIDGTKRPEDYGLPSGFVPQIGTPFPYPIRMLTTKFEEIDREVSEEEACEIAGISQKELSDFWTMICRAAGAYGFTMKRIDRTLLDEKHECIIGPGRVKMLGDTFGTPDEGRPCLQSFLLRGKVVHQSKELIRGYYGSIGYRDEVKEARRHGKAIPPYPLMPDNVVEKISKAYTEVSEKYMLV